ncbi:MAG: GAF domain-containing protein [Nitrospirae bacterium]|nr:GAF domain-containing protein [Nitrospirota bacterium]
MKDLSKQQLYDILERMSDGIVALDKNWNYIYVNKLGAEMLGRKPEDLIGKHIWTEFPEGIDQPFYKAYHNAMEKQINIRIEEYYPPWDRWFENRIYSSPDGITIFYQDITERKKTEVSLRESEQELRTINRVIATCSSTMDVYDILQRVLDEALAIAGLEGGTFCLLEPDGSLSLGAQRNASEDMIKDLTSHRIKVGDCLCGSAARDKRPLILRNRDEVHSFSTLEAALADDIRFHAAFPVIRDDICLGVLCVFTRTDRKPTERSIHLLETITSQISLSIENARLYTNILNHSEKLEEKVAERTADLERANIRLKELDRLKSIFIASMSHELRTPLNSIIGFTGIILQGLTGDITTEQRKQLSIVKKSANHLLDLINDVIDISKIESDRVELNPVDIDISRLLNEVIMSFNNELEQKGLSLNIKAPEKLIIRTDEKRVRQVLNNLLSNAIKFTDHGGIEIDVAEANGNISLSFRDTGIGIKPEDMGSLFKSFSKIRYENMPVIEGTGLGLYISYKIAQHLGGGLSAESVYGKGSAFTFTLPEGTGKS